MTDTWFTPPAIIEALGGPSSFDLDPCSPAHRPWPTAKQHYSAEQNGLLLPWFGRVWLNPPYSRSLLGRFMARMAEHGRGIALVFARTDTEVFHRHIWEVAAGLLFLRGRLQFHGSDGVADHDAASPTVLVAYGHRDLDILSMAPIDGAFVALQIRKHLLVKAFAGTWGDAVDAFMALKSGPVPLSDIYRAFASHPKAKGKRHWQDKIRQVLQERGYRRVERGVWAA